MILFLIISTLGFVSIMIVIKPRDITPILKYVNKYFKQETQKFNIKSDKVVIAWDNEHYSFDVNLLNAKLTIKNKIIKIDQLKIDISRRLLLIGKFKIDKIIVQKIIFDDLHKNKQKLSQSQIINYIETSLNNFILFKNIDIEEIVIPKIDKKNNLIIRDFLYQEIIKDRQITSSFNIQFLKERVTFNTICNYQNNKFTNCLIETQHLPKKIINHLSNSKIKSDLKLALNIKKENNLFSIDLNSSSENLILNFYQEKDIIYNNIKLSAKFSVSEQEIKASNIDFTANNKISLTGEISYKKNHLTLVAQAKNIEYDSLFLLYPKLKKLKKSRDWLKSHLKSTKISKGQIDLDFNLVNNKLNHLSGEFDIAKALLNPTKNFQDISDAKGKIILSKNSISINIYEAMVKNDKVQNIQITIPSFANKIANLYITGKNVPFSSLSLIDFLLSKISEQKTIDAMKLYFHQAQGIAEILDIKLKIANDFNINHYKLNILGKVQKISNDFISDDFNKFKISKKYNDNKFNIHINLANAKIDQEYLFFKKNSKEKLDFYMIVEEKKDVIYFRNILLQGERANIRGKVSLVNKQIRDINFINSYLGKSDFSLNLIRKKDFLIGNLIAQNLYISYPKKSQTENSSDFIPVNIDIKINNLIGLENINLDGNSGKWLYKKNYNSLYLEGNFLGGNYILKNTIKRTKNAKKEKILMEIKNFGNFTKIFDPTSQIIDGLAYLELVRKNQENYQGSLLLQNFSLINKDNLQKMLASKSLKNLKKLKTIKFEYGNIDFIYNKKKELINITDSLIYGNKLGVTSYGKINLLNKDVFLQGNIIPAYKFNNFLGLGGVPFLGDFLTGNKGIFSLSYETSGKFGKIDIDVKPLSIILPSFLKKIGRKREKIQDRLEDKK